MKVSFKVPPSKRKEVARALEALARHASVRELRFDPWDEGSLALDLQTRAAFLRAVFIEERPREIGRKKSA